MRYYTYIDPKDPAKDDFSPVYITKSEYDIKREYYPYWYTQMIKKFGEEYVNKTYCFEDCLDDWIVVNWAWESK